MNKKGIILLILFLVTLSLMGFVLWGLIQENNKSELIPVAAESISEQIEPVLESAPIELDQFIATSASSASVTSTPIELILEPDVLVQTEIIPTKETPVEIRTSSKIVFLHHSTGGVIWNGGVEAWMSNYNTTHNKDYNISALDFPKNTPYGWNNYPYDYWNIWVKNAGSKAYQEEPTLEMLTKDYDVIIWKHCFPVSSVTADKGSPDVKSPVKSIENYKLQYAALKKKMHEFPDTRFIVWTGAALVQSATDASAAKRAQEFAGWVVTTWDEPGDNIYIWDFRDLETEGGLYLLSKNAASASDSHPNAKFATRVAPLFGQRIVDVIEGRGDN